MFLMNVPTIVNKLEKLYPNKKILLLPPDNPKEIICEIKPRSKRSDTSIAIVIIEKSEPHYHKKLVETYKVLSGKLTLIVNGVDIILNEGDEYKVVPGITHSAIGNSTWVEVSTKPGWIPQDHIFVA